MRRPLVNYFPAVLETRIISSSNPLTSIEIEAELVAENKDTGHHKWEALCHKKNTHNLNSFRAHDQKRILTFKWILTRNL